MYLHKLQKDEKTAFLAFARNLARIDDQKLDDQERYMLQYMCMEMGLEPGEALAQAKKYDRDDVLKVFYRDESRRVLILEAIGICFCNGEMTESQRAELKGLADQFNLSEDFVTRAEDVVRKQLQVMQEFDELVVPVE